MDRSETPQFLQPGFLDQFQDFEKAAEMKLPNPDKMKNLSSFDNSSVASSELFKSNAGKNDME